MDMQKLLKTNNQNLIKMSNRLDQERESKIQPKRIVIAKQEITKFGFEIIKETATAIQFVFKGSVITYFPYSGWASGKSIQDGRGLENLLNQIR